MPTGIIRDPKMNPTESRYGILYSPDDKEYLAYDKISKQDPKRYWIGGMKVSYSGTETLTTVIEFDGINIRKKVDNGVIIDPDQNKNKVYAKILKKIEKEKTLFDGVDSEVPD